MKADPSQASRRRLGLLYGIIASALWGTVWVCVRYLMDVRGLEPVYMAAMRFGIGACAAVVYMLVTGRGRDLVRASAELGNLALLGSIGIFGMGVCVFFSGEYTASINSSLIVNSNAVFIAVFAALLGERVPWLRFVGLFLGLAGCATILFSGAHAEGPGSNDLLGGALGLGAAICWAAYTALGKRVVRRVGGLAASTVTLVIGALMLAALAMLRGGIRPLDGPELAVITFLGIVPTAGAMMLWYRALDLIDASALGPTQYVAPILGTLLGAGLLHEPVGIGFVLGAALVLVGLQLSSRE